MSEHEPTHDNEHDHCGSHNHQHSTIESADKLKALLHHMYHHNEDHTAELDTIVRSLEEQGKPEVAGKVKQAIEEYKKGNALLDEALKELP
ncbi:hypothetical protein [Butyrivibrio sp. VCB2006]|uniref:hypothetical protein n=1 Tax=Butyrivibrio sp. VCB2006 TaxID=1280679 RepID=UPI000419570A|nr:hypothetical protein [Butyrivibrio sp. VCB2006]